MQGLRPRAGRGGPRRGPRAPRGHRRVREARRPGAGQAEPAREPRARKGGHDPPGRGPRRAPGRAGGRRRARPRRLARRAEHARELRGPPPPHRPCARPRGVRGRGRLLRRADGRDPVAVGEGATNGSAWPARSPTPTRSSRSRSSRPTSSPSPRARSRTASGTSPGSRRPSTTSTPGWTRAGSPRSCSTSTWPGRPSSRSWTPWSGWRGTAPRTGPRARSGSCSRPRTRPTSTIVEALLMGFDPLEVPTVAEAAERGIGPRSAAELEVLGVPVDEARLPDFQRPAAHSLGRHPGPARRGREPALRGPAAGGDGEMPAVRGLLRELPARRDRGHGRRPADPDGRLHPVLLLPGALPGRRDRDRPPPGPPPDRVTIRGRGWDRSTRPPVFRRPRAVCPAPAETCPGAASTAGALPIGITGADERPR